MNLPLGRLVMIIKLNNQKDDSLHNQEEDSYLK